ncbi:hypothetical protein K438DRAFT_1990016 [Mycena galopus ATCC 62051]|nr:hypothetical protein K438DRAFT_1990016 [Mycena galopus ATCC 62051]
MATTTNLVPSIDSTTQQNGESTLLDTAKTYLPTQDDVQHAMTSVGEAAKTYLPQSLAAYLPSASSSSLETDPNLAPLRPPFLADLPVADDSALRTLSTEAQAGSLCSPHVDSSASFASTSFSDADSGKLSTVVRTGNDTIISRVPNLPATPAESPTQLPSSLTHSTPSEVPQDSPTRTPLPALPSPAVFDDAPTATQTSTNDHQSSLAPAPILPPHALPSTSAVRASGFPLPGTFSPPTSRPGSADSKFVEGIPSPMPAPAAAEDEDTPPPVQSEASPAPLPVNTPAVPGLGSAKGGPDGGALRAPQSKVEGEDAPLPLDVLPALEWAAASENTKPEPAPPAPSTAHGELGADEDSGSGSGSDAGADAAGTKQRRKKPKLLQRLKDKLHVGHAHA